MHSSTARSLRAGEAERGREAVPQEDDEEEEVQERPLRRGGALLVPGQLEVSNTALHKGPAINDVRKIHIFYQY